MDSPVSAKDSPARPRSDASPSAVTVRCWGVRGSIPDPGSHSARYGGNTSCVEVRAGGRRIILDAGTGIRRLGDEMAAGGEEASAVIFLTHFHWDHIQGLPFFAPAYDPGFTLHLFGPGQEQGGVRELLAAQMAPPYFPVPLGDLPASAIFTEVGEDPWQVGEVRMRAARVRHPSVTLGYRLEASGHSVVYIPDNDLGEDPCCLPEVTKGDLERFVQGADVLVHDAMFTDAERPGVEGWGHSTFEQVVDLALRTGVRRACFFHHAPGRTDEEMDRILEESRAEVVGRGADLEIHAASEGLAIVL